MVTRIMRYRELRFLITLIFGKTPAKGAMLYVYQTDAAGYRLAFFSWTPYHFIKPSM